MLWKPEGHDPILGDEKDPRKGGGALGALPQRGDSTVLYKPRDGGLVAQGTQASLRAGLDSSGREGGRAQVSWARGQGTLHLF